MIAAKLFKDHSDIEEREREAKALLTRWMHSCHKFCALPTRAFTRITHQADDAIRRIVVYNDVVFPPYPACLAADMAKLNTAEIENNSKDARSRLVNAIWSNNCGEGGTFRLDKECLINKQQQPEDEMWKPLITRQPGQSNPSFEEQKQCLHALVGAVDQLVDDHSSFVNGIALLGPPGAGKTYLLTQGILYALSRNLNVGLTSLTAERSLQLGGTHLHQMFCIMETHGQKTSQLDRIVKSAVQSLENNNKKLSILLKLQVLAIEEIGLISAEMLSAIDGILRKIKASNLPFGGVLILATGDARQLPPVEGSPSFRSSHFWTTLRVYLLKHYVRAAQDHLLQELLDLLYKINLCPSEIERVKEIFRTINNVRCGWNNAEPASVKIVSKRDAVREVSVTTMEHRRRKVQSFNTNLPPGHTPKRLLEVKAQDFYDATKTDWLPVHADMVADITKQVNLVESMVLSEGGVFMFVNNDQSVTPPRFTNGQLCVIHKIHGEPGQNPSTFLMVDTFKFK